MAINFEKDEKIIYEVRKHWFVLFEEILLAIFFTLLPVFIYAGLKALEINFVFSGNPTALILFAYFLWLLIVWEMILIVWTDYYLDVWIITNKRLIDVDQKGLFRREIASLDLHKIQDVTSEVNGFVATMLEFGSIHVQTAGSEKEFVIHKIVDPNQTRKKLNDAIRVNTSN